MGIISKEASANTGNLFPQIFTNSLFITKNDGEQLYLPKRMCT